MKHAYSPSQKSLFSLVIGAIGVVYGDIGTSPLYALREVFGHDRGLALNSLNLFGALSLFFWSLTLVVTVKYIVFVLRADNRGEGGTFALLALVRHVVKTRTLFVTAMGIFGAALFYGDGIITPAISVLSAVEGLAVKAENLQQYVIPITLVILIMLFAVQQNGTDLLARFFGPVTCVWFVAIGLTGVLQIWENPHILAAMNPFYAVDFFFDHPLMSFITLGTIVLAVTGVEALYADMGHFGIKPIRIAWLVLVMPCLVLNYFGQGALLLAYPGAIDNPFYHMVPEWGLYPMIGLATCATIIASQAMISGAFSITQQAIQLGFMPRIKICYTSAHNIGQIYIPKLNTLLFIGVIFLVLMFQSSSALAAAYGIAVTGTMTITSMLLFIVVRRVWRWSWMKIYFILVPFFIIDVAFFSSTLTKLLQSYGAWVPLVLGAIISLVMLTWHQGTLLKRRRVKHDHATLEDFILRQDGRKVRRIPGTAIYLTGNPRLTPEALEIHARHHHTLHEKIVLVHVAVVDIPQVPESARLSVDDLGKGFLLVTISYGFMQSPNIPRALGHLMETTFNINIREAPYFVNRDHVFATPGGGMWLWREKLYAVMHQNAASVISYYNLPPHRVIEIGAPVSI
jgi:KUP system potassium uptake protein